MKAVGIICEYNPFHNGHIYHLQKVKELFPNHRIILVMSSCFMQRGESSLITKWDKTEIALSYGVDIVIELPFVFATQSADFFAKGAIYLLKQMNVSHIVFGSESHNIKDIEKIVRLQNSKKYHKKVKENIKTGVSYPTAVALSLLDLKGKVIQKPNDLLALSYIKAIQDFQYNIIPVSIKRTNDYHSLSSDIHITSASSIRKKIEKNEDITTYIPKESKEKMKKDFFIDNYFPFLKYKIMTEKENLEKYQTVDEGMASRIKKYITESASREELINHIKTKRYTYNKISRMLTHILCNFTKEEANMFTLPSYIRILGFSAPGQKYIKERKGKTEIPILTKFEKKYKMLQIEKRVVEVYASILEESQKKEFIEKEYKNHSIFYKE